RGWLFSGFAPWLSVGLFVGGSGLALIEGLICIAMALPLFLVIGSAGGLVMGLICRLRNRRLRTVQSISLLPLLMVLGEGLIPAGNGITRLERSLYIAAPPAEVWQLILNPSDIRPEELDGGLAYRIGVPYPIQARTLEEKVGGIRRSTWARGVSFDERITDWQPDQHLAWTYEFGANSFPPGTMDEHVVIGGEYFDLLDTAYRLTPEPGGTRLQMSISFRTSTKFNWYAVPLAKLMIGDTAQVLLGFYKQRAEAKSKPLLAER
ncbi:MAG: SRPBCC family protein, partial [Pseudomonadota bacterium]